MRKRAVKIALGVVLLLLALISYPILRATAFAPRFDVTSIAQAPQYRDAALVERAWTLPVAATFGRKVSYQTNGSTCGPTTVANAFRSLGEPVTSVDGVLDGSGKCWTGVCFMGLTLDELAEVTARKTKRKVTVLRDLSLEAFRAEMKKTNDPSRRTLVNFHRGPLFGRGGGHHSPIGGYLDAEDLVFVLDVNESFGPWLVSTERLYRAVELVDESSGKKRGLIVLE